MKIQHTLLSWLITCIGGSILLLIGFLLLDHGSSGILDNNNAQTLLYILFYGSAISLAASVPAFILYHVLGILLHRSGQDRMVIKAILTIYAALAPLVTLWLISAALLGERHLFERENNEVLSVLLPYMACFAVCVWLFGNKTSQPAIAATEGTGVAADDHFPKQTVAIYTLIVILAECWSLYSLFRFWKYYHTPDKLLTPVIIALNVTAVILLCMRKTYGWLASAVLSTCFTLTPLLFLGKAIVNKEHDLLRAVLNFQWICFVLLDITALVLLFTPGMRRYFRITAHQLGTTVIVGCLLAAALFFIRL